MARWRRRGRYDLPEDWEDQVARRVPTWWDRSVAERTRLRDLMVPLLAETRWEAARGFEMTEEVRLVISSQAALLLLGLDLDRFPNVGSILVRERVLVDDGERPDAVPGVMTDEEVEVAGEAGHGIGPVMVAWEDVVWDLRHPRRGRNVVVHEFAHKLDMLDDVVDGTPPMDQALLDRWVAVCTAAFEELEASGSPVLDDYGTEDAGEFFAVAAEVFFTRPEALAEHHPSLYDVLAAYFGQDPAGRG